MNTMLAGDVLAKAAAYDPSMPRTNDATLLAWAEALGNLDREAALAAVARHYRTETRRIMPADVVNAVDSPQSRMPAYRPWAVVKAEIEARDAGAA